MAGEKTHTVSSGDSASSIAAKYYGDVELGDFLLRYNGKGGTVIHAGEKLKIPYCDVHKVGKGDTWSSLSTKHLEKTQAYPAIASLNGFAAGAVLPVGGQIVIPVVLSWKLESGDSLASLAGRWYGDPNRADLLQLFNDVEDPKRLSVGAAAMDQLASIRLRKSAAAELPQKKPAPVRLAQTASAGADKAPSKSPVVAKAAQPASSDAGKTTAKAAAVSKTPAPAQSSPSDPKKPAPAKTGANDKTPARAGTPDKTAGKAADADKAPAKAGTSDKAPAKTATTHAKEVAPKPESAPVESKEKPVAPQTAAAPPTPPPTSKTVDVPKPEPTVQSAPRFEKEFRAAEKEFAEGNYASARQLLESLRERSRDGTDEERGEILRLLAFVYVAFDMRTEACIAYNSLPVAPTPTTLDPDVVSPRIRDALSRCPAGKV